MPKNAFYAQSGGVTAVINATACGLIETAKLYPKINTVYAGVNGILGALNEELIDTYQYTQEQIKSLYYTPGGAFGSCRYQLKDQSEFEQLIKVFKAHNIGYFFYNGGGDSQDTTHKLSEYSKKINYPLTCIGIPKTIDNDLPFTDNSPGFGSVAKYIAISTMEASLDVASMAKTSTKVFILEVMGRHAGWIAASSAIGKHQGSDPPHIILFPEIPFEPEAFLAKVKFSVTNYGYCTIVVAEGVRDTQNQFLADSGVRDAFGHAQLGGAAQTIAQLIKQQLKYKYHYAIADYLQRSARHIASQTDITQAYELGKSAVLFALQNKTGIMPIIKRLSSTPYTWEISEVALQDVANTEKKLPRSYITTDGFNITSECLAYLTPLIQGESYPPYSNGLPQYLSLPLTTITKRCS